MDAHFYQSLTEGDFGDGPALLMSLGEGDFWPRRRECVCLYRGIGHPEAIAHHRIVAVKEGTGAVTIPACALPGMTAPTPMIIPSIVRADRILLARRERNETFAADSRFMRAHPRVGMRCAGGGPPACPPRSGRPGTGSPDGGTRRCPVRA